jgi:hypothetical protein
MTIDRKQFRAQHCLLTRHARTLKEKQPHYGAFRAYVPDMFAGVSAGNWGQRLADMHGLRVMLQSLVHAIDLANDWPEPGSVHEAKSPPPSLPL